MALNHDSVTLQRLRAYQKECGDQKLALECAMVEVLCKAVKFTEAFENGPRRTWSGYFGGMRIEIKKLKELLKSEFPEIKGEAQPAPKEL
jgi:hypothetical protein